MLPLEADPATFDEHENIGLAVLDELREKARAEGLWCLQLKRETGGQGLGKVGMAVCYEEMNRSIFGPAVFNSAAPDDGNMMVLEQAGTPVQKERWLKPIVEGKVRSSFIPEWGPYWRCPASTDISTRSAVRWTSSQTRLLSEFFFHA